MAYSGRLLCLEINVRRYKLCTSWQRNRGGCWWSAVVRYHRRRLRGKLSVSRYGFGVSSSNQKGG